MTHPSVSKIAPEEGSIEAVQVLPGEIPEIAGFDKIVFGADRTPLIHHLYKNRPELAWLIRENNQVAGYCLGRRGVKFTQIGPVYGSSEAVAKSLIRSAIHTIAGKSVVVDIHAAQTGMIRWLEGHGFTSQRSFDRMYLYNNPHPGFIDYQYLICGPELG